MSEEHLQGQGNAGEAREVPKRIRTPSQYAAQIADFKNNNSIPHKRSKSVKNIQANQSKEENSKEPNNKLLTCVLPSGKRYFLKIVAGNIKSSKSGKMEKKKNTIVQPSPPPLPKEHQKKDANQSFFIKFLEVCEELQKKSQNDSKQPNQPSKENDDSRIVRKQDKLKRERERQDKWTKFYDRLKVLTERTDKLEDNYIFLN